MPTGIVGGLKIREKVRTYYRLHPNQEKYPGALMEMPNLPDDQYHWEMWQLKGYKPTKEELMPGKSIVWEEKWGMYRFDISPTQASQPMKICSVCQKPCVGEFGLKAHMRSHEKKSAEGGT